MLGEGAQIKPMIAFRRHGVELGQAENLARREKQPIEGLALT